MPESPRKRRGHEKLVSGRAVVVSSVAEPTADGCMGRQWDCYVTQVGGWSSFCVRAGVCPNTGIYPGPRGRQWCAVPPYECYSVLD